MGLAIAEMVAVTNAAMGLLALLAIQDRSPVAWLSCIPLLALSPLSHRTG